MVNIKMKTLQSEGFGLWERYDKGDKESYSENTIGDYAIMLFPKDEALFEKYKTTEMYDIFVKKLTEIDIAKIDVADEDTRMGFMAFGLMIYDPLIYEIKGVKIQ